MMTDAPNQEDDTLARKLRGAFTIVGALAALACVAAAGSYLVSRVWLTPQFERSLQAQAAENAAFAAMLDQENGLHAYLITNDLAFREPYVEAVGALERANEVLTAHVGSESRLFSSMMKTRLAEARWRERWALVAADHESKAGQLSMLQGKALFDDYRREQALFSRALWGHTAELYRREQRMIAVRVSVAVLIAAIIFFVALRQHRALRRSIVVPVAALLRRIAGVRDGQLESVLEPAGPRELRQLGEGLNEMVASLATAHSAAKAREAELHAHFGRLRQILEASREFSESHNLSYVVGAVRATTASVGGYQRVIVWLMDEEHKRLIDSESSGPMDTHSLAGSDEPAHGLAHRAAKSGRSTFEGLAGKVGFSDHDVSPVLALASPLIVGARVVGALEARYEAARVPTHEALEVLEMLAVHAATAIESARLHEVIEARSQTDGLTLLFNRRRLDSDLAAECKRCARYGRPLAFVMLDIDHFKQFNDAHGHPAADRALQLVAGLVTSCLRATDSAYRYGGEEFAILLRETSGHDAMVVAERVRLRIEENFATGPMAGITASFGVAEFGSDKETPVALAEAADAAMYESKRAGRNRVVLSTRPSGGPLRASITQPPARAGE